MVPTAVLRSFSNNCLPTEVEPLGSCRGLSGALFWRLTTPRGVLCLRRWPQIHPDRDRLTWIHHALQFVAPRCTFLLPVPIETRLGTSFVDIDGHLWELTPWLAGAPLSATQEPASERVAAAATALAELHLALAAFAICAGDQRHVAIGPAPGIRRRLELLKEAELPPLQDAARRFPDEGRLARPLHRLAAALAARWESLAAGIRVDLEAAARLQVPLQPCLRDIWRPHVLFRGSAVSGIIDFGALNVDTVAADLARLLGSLAAQEARVWSPAISAYEAVRPLSRQERGLIAAYDRSGVFLGAVNWLRWLAVERRPFPPQAAIEDRLKELTSRLGTLPATSEAHPALL